MLWSLLAVAQTGHSAPDVKVVKDDKTPAGVRKQNGDSIQYGITIANTGSEAATDVVLVDPTPANTTLDPDSLNISPLAMDDAFEAVGNTLLRVGGEPGTGPEFNVAGSLTANDREFLGDTFTIDTGTISSEQGGTVTILADGSFTYLPPAGFTGVDRFTYTIRDDGADGIPGNEDDLSDSAVVAITVSGRIWYVDNSAPAGGDGRSSSPLSTLAPLNGAGDPDNPGDIIYLHTGNGPYATGLTLENNQTVVGNGAPLVAGGRTLRPAGAPPLITNPTGNGITLASGNTLRGLAIGNASGIALSGASTGALTVSQVAINTSGAALSLSNGTFADGSSFTSITSSGGDNGILLNNMEGYVNLGEGGLSGHTQNALRASGGAGSFSYAGTISKTANSSVPAVSITGKNGGTAIFSGQISASANTPGIALESNTGGAAIHFTGGLNLSTGTQTAFSATGGGTVVATQNNTSIVNRLTTTAGVALNVSGVTIGDAGLAFRSIQSSGGANAIILNNTGSGALTVTGTNSADSGGTIQNQTGDAIRLSNTGPVSLRDMRVTGSGENHINASTVAGLALTRVNTDLSTRHGITGSNVRNLVIQDCVFDRSGAAHASGDFSAIHVTNLLGTSSIKGTVFKRSDANQVYIVNNTATNFNGVPDTLTVSGTQWNTHAGDHLAITADTESNFQLIMDASDGVNEIVAGGIGARAVATGINGKLNVSITGLKTSDNTSGVWLTQNGGGLLTYDIFGNKPANGSGFSNTGSVAIAVQHLGSGGISKGYIQDNNVIHSAGPGTNAMQIIVEGNGTGTASVTGNVVYGDFQRGFQGQARLGTGELNLTLSGNLFTGTDPTGEGLQGVNIETGGSGSGHANIIRLNMQDNVVAYAPGAVYPASYRLINRASCTFLLQNFTGSGSNTDNVRTWVTSTKGNQTGGGSVSVTATSPFGAAIGPIPAPLLFQPTPASQAVPNVPAAPLFETRSATVPVNDGVATPLPEETGETPPGSGRLPSGDDDSGSLTQEKLDAIARAAIARWEATGLREDQKAKLRELRFEIADLPGAYLGKNTGSVIYLDRDAAGSGWFVDATPEDDAEFTSLSDSHFVSSGENGAIGKRVDLLTAVMHEIGHSLGLEDVYFAERSDMVMHGLLPLGQRRLPRFGEAAGLPPDAAPEARHLSSPINIGTLPPGKTVTIVYRVTINPDNPEPWIYSQGIVSGSNFDDVPTDDPETIADADPTITPVALPPTLGPVTRFVAEDSGTFHFTQWDFIGAFMDVNPGDTLQEVRVLSLPTKGILRLGGAEVAMNQLIPAINLDFLSYTPADDENGPDGFAWTASDGTLFALAPAAVNIVLTEVNDPPVPVDDVLPNVAEDSGPIVISKAALLANDSAGPPNESFQTLSITAVNNVVGGAVVVGENDITFTLERDFNGTAGFTYTVADNGTTDGVDDPREASATVTFTVTPVNDAPVITGQHSVSMPEDGSREIVFTDLIVSDPDNTYPDGFTLVAGDGDHYTRSGNIITPAANFHGALTVPVIVNDGEADSGVFLLSVTITPVNDDPVAGNDVITRHPGQSVKVAVSTLLANDTDVDGDELTFVSAGPASNGTVTVSGGTVFYTPNAGFTGEDSFPYTISDGQGGAAVGTVTVVVTADDTAPGLSIAKMEVLPDGSLRLVFAGIPGRVYRVQSSDTLAPDSWVDRATLAADALGRFEFIDPAPLPPSRFYRTVQP